MSENKADLSKFLSEQMLSETAHGKTIVITGGFCHEEAEKTTSDTIDVQQLQQGMRKQTPE